MHFGRCNDINIQGISLWLPIDGPMNILHVDGFTFGASINYADDKGFLIATCGMCTFAVAEPVTESNLNTYAQAL